MDSMEAERLELDAGAILVTNLNLLKEQLLKMVSCPAPTW